MKFINTRLAASEVENSIYQEKWKKWTHLASTLWSSTQHFLMSGNGGMVPEVLVFSAFWLGMRVRVRRAGEAKLLPCLLTAVTEISYMVNGLNELIRLELYVPGT